VATWGDEWPSIKKHGANLRAKLASRHVSPRTSKSIAPAITELTTCRITKAGNLSTSHTIRVSYMEMTGSGKSVQRVRSFAYGKPSSRWTRDEAVEKAVTIRNEKVSAYKEALELALEQKKKATK